MNNPYEIHITVDLNKSVSQGVDVFKDNCKHIGVKPIVLDLQNKSGVSEMSDVMTSSRFKGDDSSAIFESDVIVKKLEDFGYKVVRTKIESFPYHPLSPKSDKELMPKNCYFESHVPVKVCKGDLERLSKTISMFQHPVHMSKNIFKVFSDHFIVMLTYRDSKTYASKFVENVEDICRVLNNSGFEFNKIESEFALYDTNVVHDSKWIGGSV